MSSTFTNKDGDQNIAQGRNAIGKQINKFFCRLLGRISTQGKQSPVIVLGRDATVIYNNSYGISQERFEALRDKYEVTDSALRNFFNILEQDNVPPGELDAKLREIAERHKHLLQQHVGKRQTETQRTAWESIESGNYTAALSLYEQSLAISRAIGDMAGQTTTLNNIGQIYYVQGKYGTALNYLEQSLAISRQIGDMANEALLLNNIAQVYAAKLKK